MKKNLQLPIVAPGKKPVSFYIYYFIVAAILPIMYYACHYQSAQMPWFCVLLSVSVCVWALFMTVPHKKMATLSLEADHFILYKPNTAPQRLPLAELNTIQFYIDGAAADTPEYMQDGNLPNGVQQPYVKYLVEPRSGTNNLLAFTYEDIRYVYHLLLLDRNMEQLNDQLLQWQQRGYAIEIEDHSGRNIPYQPV